MANGPSNPFAVPFAIYYYYTPFVVPISMFMFESAMAPTWEMVKRVEGVTIPVDGVYFVQLLRECSIFVFVIFSFVVICLCPSRWGDFN